MDGNVDRAAKVGQNFASGLDDFARGEQRFIYSCCRLPLFVLGLIETALCQLKYEKDVNQSADFLHKVSHALPILSQAEYFKVIMYREVRTRVGELGLDFRPISHTDQCTRF